MQISTRHHRANSRAALKPALPALALLYAASLAIGLPGSAALAQQAPIQITVSPDIPFDVADPSNLEQAAIFAWNEFIALTWPAPAQGPTSFPRGVPKTDGSFGDPSAYGKRGPTGQVVWETYRHRIEAFPGQGEPNGYDAAAPDFGFSAKPAYVYRGGFSGIPANGIIPPARGLSDPDVPPFHNLDEVTQIVLNAMYAGIVDPSPHGGVNVHTDVKEKILFEAKVNEVVYAYVARPRGPANDPFAYYEGAADMRVMDIKQNSVEFLKTGDAIRFPPPYIELPPSNPAQMTAGSIEIKAAWRRINTDLEDASRFYIAPVRYYVGEIQDIGGVEIPKIEGFVDSNDPKVNETWGLVALHIIHKTPNVPAFTYATFGHIDNILAADGTPVEEPDGTTKPQYLNLPPYSAALTILDSTALGGRQRAIQGGGTANTNLPQLYYNNLNKKAVIEVPTTKTELFAAPVNLAAELSRGFIPDALRGLFSDNGITTLPANPTNDMMHPPVEVLVADSEWLILDRKDKSLTYHIEREDSGLRVFSVALYQGPVNVNRRIYPIPPKITQANRNAHAAMRQANPDAVWLNYRLINVQAQPLNRDSIPTGEEATYFLANEVVETNTSLQQFSGALQGSITGRITDYPFVKTVNGQATFALVSNMFIVNDGVPTGFDMGGCMGCHGGQGQTQGGDFSILLARGRITRPDIVQEDEKQDEALMMENTLRRTPSLLGGTPEN